MFKSLVLGLVSLIPTASFASSQFAVKIYPGNQFSNTATAVVPFVGINAFCIIHFLSSGADSLTRVYDCEGKTSNPETDVQMVRVIAVKSPTAKHFEGMLTTKGASGIAQSVIACSEDPRGFYGCVFVDRD